MLCSLISDVPVFLAEITCRYVVPCVNVGVCLQICPDSAGSSHMTALVLTASINIHRLCSNSSSVINTKVGIKTQKWTLHSFLSGCRGKNIFFKQTKHKLCLFFITKRQQGHQKLISLGKISIYLIVTLVLDMHNFGTMQ